jgi:hypothetical protein
MIFFVIATALGVAYLIEARRAEWDSERCYQEAIARRLEDLQPTLSQKQVGASSVSCAPGVSSPNAHEQL